VRPSAQAVGTQGDIQPFVAVALRLRELGHRVRVATHGPLQAFVERYGLEFYDIGGDPAVLAEFAVQSKGARAPSAACPCQAYEAVQSTLYVLHLSLCCAPDSVHVCMRKRERGENTFDPLDFELTGVMRISMISACMG
jgi:hypothetical protein